MNNKDKSAIVRARTTEIIFDGADGYFAAMLNDGGVRIGLKGCQHFDFPVGHKEHGRVMAAAMAEEIEFLHDEFMCTYAYGW